MGPGQPGSCRHAGAALGVLLKLLIMMAPPPACIGGVGLWILLWTVLCVLRPALQVISQTVQVTDRLGPFMEGLDVPAVVLLTSQRLVASAAAAVSGQGPSSGSGGSGLRLAAEPPKRAVEEARLSIKMALAHVAQRLGHAHLSRRGFFGFGSQQVRLCEVFVCAWYSTVDLRSCMTAMARSLPVGSWVQL